VENKLISVEEIQGRLIQIRKQIGIHFGYTGNNNPPDLRHYYVVENDKTIVNDSRYFRNIKTFQRLQSIVNRLHPFYTSMEFFDGNVRFERLKGEQWTKGYVVYLFTSTMVDTFRSIVDIFSIMVSIYYDLPKPEKRKFSRDDFIRLIKDFSTEIYSHSLRFNEKLYNSELYKFRTSEKHLGFISHDITIEQSTEKGKKKISISRVERIDLDHIRFEVIQRIGEFLDLLEISVNEMCKHPLGYISDNDVYSEITPEGHYKIIEK